jgi:hypothetical protein
MFCALVPGPTPLCAWPTWVVAGDVTASSWSSSCLHWLDRGRGCVMIGHC